jgi:5-methylcytosine-specific restriction protein A
MFEQGRIYRRRDLHERFGGQRQGGISTPKEHPLVFLVTGESGVQYAYHDG